MHIPDTVGLAQQAASLPFISVESVGPLTLFKAPSWLEKVTTTSAVSLLSNVSEVILMVLTTVVTLFASSVNDSDNFSSPCCSLKSLLVAWQFSFCSAVCSLTTPAAFDNGEISSPVAELSSLGVSAAGGGSTLSPPASESTFFSVLT
uniref:Uncharacterized protein n=1 Tax=Glossina pallidipes TaxID=7398 RepID=A0A1A9ZVS0_GLOPL